MPRALLYRPRLSLLTLLLLLTVAAMVIAIWKLYAEVVPLRAENRELRDELGELSIDDPDKVHAILTPQSEPGRFNYKWRLWIPEGRRYKLCWTTSKVPKQGFPTKPTSLPLPGSGEHWLEYRIFLEEETGKWRDLVYTHEMSYSGDYQDWPTWDPRIGTGETVGETTHVFDPAERVVLARWHIGRSKASAQIEYPSAGFLIWLEPLK